MEAKTKPQKNFTSPRHPEKLAPHTSISDNLGRISTQSRISNNLAHESQKHKTSAHKIYAASLLRDTDVVEQRGGVAGGGVCCRLGEPRCRPLISRLSAAPCTSPFTAPKGYGRPTPRATPTHTPPSASAFIPALRRGRWCRALSHARRSILCGKRGFPSRGASTSCAAALCISTYSTMIATRAAHTTG